MLLLALSSVGCERMDRWIDGWMGGMNVGRYVEWMVDFRWYVMLLVRSVGRLIVSTLSARRVNE